MTLDKRLLRLEAKVPDKGDALADAAFAVWCKAIEAIGEVPEGVERDAYIEMLVAASGGALAGEGRK